MSALHELPIDEIKLDRSFVMRMEEGRSGEEVVRAVVSLSRALRKRVVIEGIETRRQLERLVELHCDMGQGFLLAHPASSDIVESVLRRDAVYSTAEATAECTPTPRLKTVTLPARPRFVARA